MDYEFIIEVMETSDVSYANRYIKSGWVLLSAPNPIPDLRFQYSLGWDKRNGETPVQPDPTSGYEDDHFSKLL